MLHCQRWENLDKMKEKGDECIFVGYSTQSRAYRVFNKITRVIMESIHANFDELPQMASAHNSSDPAPTCQTMASVQISSDPAPECQTMALEHGSLSPGQPHAENDEVADDEFINIFSTSVQDLGKTSSRHEEVYFNQPDGFVDPYRPDKVYRLKKALYGLK
nr:hypothetical protein [Tanacetum cinerariifolium]